MYHSESVVLKVGDLVELSSKGRNILWCRNLREKTGVVVEVATHSGRLHNIRVSWIGKGSWWIHRTYLKMVAKG